MKKFKLLNKNNQRIDFEDDSDFSESELLDEMDKIEKQIKVIPQLKKDTNSNIKEIVKKDNTLSNSFYGKFNSTYSLKGRTILFVGGGNLSFELSFAKKHPKLVYSMVATTFDTLEELDDQTLKNKQLLELLGVKIYHRIDATRLHCLGFIKQMNVKHIYFCHPYTTESYNSSDSDEDWHSSRKNLPTSELLQYFFSSVNCAEVKNCKIHIIRVRGRDYELNKNKKDRKFFKTKDGYNLIKHYKDVYGFYDMDFCGFKLIAKHRFNEKRYPGYFHAKTNDITDSSEIVSGDNSLEYVFEQINIKHSNSLSDSDYNSEDIDSDNNSEDYENKFSEQFTKNSDDENNFKRVKL